MKRSTPASPPEGAEVSELRDSIRVLGEVIRHLAERVEILEAREPLVRFRPLEG